MFCSREHVCVQSLSICGPIFGGCYDTRNLNTNNTVKLHAIECLPKLTKSIKNPEQRVPKAGGAACNSPVSASTSELRQNIEIYKSRQWIWLSDMWHWSNLYCLRYHLSFPSTNLPHSFNDIDVGLQSIAVSRIIVDFLLFSELSFSPRLTWRLR